MNCVAISPDGQLIAAGDENRTARIWKLDGSAGPVLEGHYAARFLGVLESRRQASRCRQPGFCAFEREWKAARDAPRVGSRRNSRRGH